MSTQTEPGLLSEIEYLAETITSSEESSCNEYPIEAFPQVIQMLVQSARDNLHFPIEYTSSSILSASGVAIGNKAELEVKKNWKEQPALFVAIVGKPGEHKTHSQKMAYAPIAQRDREMLINYEAAIKKYKKDWNDWKNKTDKNGQEEPEKPTCKRLIISDLTVEGMYPFLKESGALGIVVDELNSFLANTGRYNNGSDDEVWLSAFSRADINIVRATKEPIFIPSPCLSIIGGIQPKRLNQLGKDGRSESGLIHRYIYAFPDQSIQDEWSDNDIPVELSRAYSNIINRILDMPSATDSDGNIIPKMLRMNSGAYNKWKSWFNSNARLKYEAQDDNISGIYTKLESYTLRFALILQILTDTCNRTPSNEISESIMSGAIKLTEYYRHTALKVAAIISNSSPLNTEPKDFQELYKKLPKTFRALEAKEIAESFGFAQRKLERYYTNGVHFTKLERGLYEKKF